MFPCTCSLYFFSSAIFCGAWLRGSLYTDLSWLFPVLKMTSLLICYVMTVPGDIEDLMTGPIVRRGKQRGSRGNKI